MKNVCDCGCKKAIGLLGYESAIDPDTGEKRRYKLGHRRIVHGRKGLVSTRLIFWQRRLMRALRRERAESLIAQAGD
jgi:hypothetical protein